MSRNRSPESRIPARIAQETVVRFSNSATVCLKVSRCLTQDARDAFAHDASVLRARPRGAPQLGSVVVRRRVSLGLRTAAGGVCRAGVVRAPEVAGLQRRSGSACRVTGCDRGRDFSATRTSPASCSGVGQSRHRDRGGQRRSRGCRTRRRRCSGGRPQGSVKRRSPTVDEVARHGGWVDVLRRVRAVFSGLCSSARFGRGAWASSRHDRPRRGAILV